MSDTVTMRRRDRLRSDVPVIINRFLWIGVVLLLLDTIFPRVRWLQTVRDIYSLAFDVVEQGPAMAAFLAILAVAIVRRKRVAWLVWSVLLMLQLVLSALVLVVLSITPAQRGDTELVLFGVLRLVTGGLLLAMTMWARREFDARTARSTWRRALATFATGLLITVAVGTILVLVVPEPTHPSRGSRLRWLWHRLTGLASDSLISFPHWVAVVIGLLAAATLLGSFWVLMRSRSQVQEPEPDAELRLRGLIAQSDDSLAYFATRREKSWCFAPDGQAAVAHRVVLGTCLAAGDPLGPKDAWPGAIAAWQRLARTYGWVPAVIGASEAGAEAYARHGGLKVMRLGDEAILESREFHLDDVSMRPVRKSVQRLRRLGYRSRIRRQSELSPAELEQLIALADQWREGETERGFSMALGRLGDPMDADCLIVEALFPSGTERAGTEVAGLLTFVPWGRDGFSLDLMRRHPESDNGVTEFMVAEMMAAGIARVSLNFAVFRAAFEEGARIGAGPLVRMWRRMLLVASRWWQIESLYRANAKYLPAWQPRFLCFSDSADIARVGAATGVAEGFLDLPRWLVSEPPEAAAPDPSRLPQFLPAPPQVTVRRPDQVRVREAKRAELVAGGIDPYPPSFRPEHHCRDVADLPDDFRVVLAARVVRARWHGGVAFLDLRDWTGEVQVVCERAAVDVRGLKRAVDLGDHVGVTGVVGVSRSGTRSVLASTVILTSKATRPLPNTWQGITSPETRVRQRYLDLIVNADARDTLLARSTALQAVRSTLLERGFLEVETPILQTIHGGANARPFRTHINAYDLDLYLRIAPELYLKRLLVGGVDRVFEMGRNFRNEGADATHNPEFSMLEAYQTYADYTDMQQVAEDLIRNAVRAATRGSTIVGADHLGQRHTVDVGDPFRVMTVNDAISAACGEHITADTSRADLVRIAEGLDIGVDPRWNRGNVLLELYEHLVEDRTVEPTFYRDFPAEVSPLTRPHREDARLAERWDLVAFGAEIGTAYSEMVDPVVQRQRLTEQSLQAAGGDPEAMELDEDFLVALEHGMPPAGGMGMGLDRLVMFITDSSIREVLTFPLVRPGSGA